MDDLAALKAALGEAEPVPLTRLRPGGPRVRQNLALGAGPSSNRDFDTICHRATELALSQGWELIDRTGSYRAGEPLNMLELHGSRKIGILGPGPETEEVFQAVQEGLGHAAPPAAILCFANCFSSVMHLDYLERFFLRDLSTEAVQANDPGSNPEVFCRQLAECAAEFGWVVSVPEILPGTSLKTYRPLPGVPQLVVCLRSPATEEAFREIAELEAPLDGVPVSEPRARQNLYKRLIPPTCGAVLLGARRAAAFRLLRFDREVLQRLIKAETAAWAKPL